jgi:mRNA interferase MazF
VSYVPNRGDLIWIQFSPHSGHEQGGRRPGLVLSQTAYNSKTGLAMICPITSRHKGHPYDVVLPDNLQITGVVMADHAKSLDWVTRQAVFICEAPPELLDEVLGKLETLLF